MINFVYRFHEVGCRGGGGGVLVIPRGRSNNHDFQEKMCGGYDAAILTILYLKVLLIACFHKTFKLIFLKQPSWPKNRELPWAPFLGNFCILLEQQFCGTLVKSCLLEFTTVFLIKNKVFTQHLVNRSF